jgi:hypothetical protein
MRTSSSSTHSGELMLWRPVPLSVRTDPLLGGRWTSLRTLLHEWLWINPDPEIAQARKRVLPGTAFVDAGGAEECFPTVRGKPDHGDAWTRTWSTDGAEQTVDVPQVGRLSRRISGDDPVVIDYEVTGRPGTAFLHALHALLDLSLTARLTMPGSPRITVLDVDDPEREWPNGLDTLGPDDGTAICALVPECHEVAVVDGEYVLRFAWDSGDAPELCSLLLWRNLAGWPAQRPYRSIGVEPMVGRAADLSTAAPNACARIGRSGHFRWVLRISCATSSRR